MTGSVFHERVRFLVRRSFTLELGGVVLDLPVSPLKVGADVIAALGPELDGRVMPPRGPPRS